MNLSEYMLEAAKTANPNAHQWEHYLLGMGDEVGEVQKIFKKIVAYVPDGNVDYQVNFGKDKHGVPYRTRLIEELGDLHWFMSQLCRLYNISPEKVLEANIRKLQGARYDDGFSAEEADDRDLAAEADAIQAK